MIEWLIDTTFYTGLLIGALLLLRRPVARAFGAEVAYALWALPFLRLLMPPLVLPACFALFGQPDSAPLADGAEPLFLPAAAASPAPAPMAEPLLALGWSDMLVALWLGGAAVFLAWRVTTYRQMRRDVLADARPVGEVGRVRLVETPVVGAPVAFGVRDKVVALPLFFMAQPDREARDLAIAHELAHHRGHDLLANFAAQAVLALHWFNPLAWLGWRAMRRDQEAACDARVMAGRGRGERALYAALIAGTAAGPRLALAAPMACPVLGEASIIHRLRSLSRGDLPRSRRWLGRGLLAAGALTLPLSASITYAAEEDRERRDRAGAPLAPLPPAPLARPIPASAPQAPTAPFTPQPPLPPEAPAEPAPPNAAGEHWIVVERNGPVRHRVVTSAPLHAEAQVEHGTDKKRRVVRHRIIAPPHGLDEREMERLAELSARYAERMAKEGERIEREAELIAEQFEREFAEGGKGHARIMRFSAESAAKAEVQALAMAARALRDARLSIVANPELSEQVRREVLRELDREIADLGKDS